MTTKTQKEDLKDQLKSIRNFCLECMGWDEKGVKNCRSLDCPLRAYRFGKTPSVKSSPKGRNGKGVGRKA